MSARRGGTGDAEALWRFCLALYARPGVAGALLGLQNRAGCEVGLLLFLLWLGAVRGQTIDAAAVAGAAAALTPIDDGVVKPLCRLRGALKEMPDPDIQQLRRQIAGLEIAAERQGLNRLAAMAACAEARADRVDAARANLALYLGDAAGSKEAEVLRCAVIALSRGTAALNPSAD